MCVRMYAVGVCVFLCQHFVCYGCARVSLRVCVCVFARDVRVCVCSHACVSVCLLVCLYAYMSVCLYGDVSVCL